MVTAVGAFLYMAFVVGIWLLLWMGTDDWWLPSILAYGPRWVYLLPLLVFVPVVLVRRRWSLLGPLAVAAWVGVWPIMGLCVPLGLCVSLGGASADEATVRVLTLNVGGERVDNRLLLQLIQREKPDVVLLQECGNSNVSEMVPQGWNVAKAGHLGVASPYELQDQQVATSSYPPSKWPPTRGLYVSVGTPGGPIDVCSVHLRTAQKGIVPVLDRHTVVNPSQKYILKRELESRRRQAEELARWMEQFRGPLIIAGDFNMPSDSVIYRSCWGPYTNAFSQAGLGFGRTRWISMRGVTFGVRIDHILTNEHWRPQSCWVGPDVGSDHLPVIADLSPAKK